MMNIDPPPTTPPPPSAAHAARSSMRRDVTAAYVAAGARIGAWAVVSAIVYRLAGPAHFALLALIRGTIGILNYTAVGLAPALIRLLAEAVRDGGREASEALTAVADTLPTPLHYSQPAPPTEERAIFSTGVVVASLSAGAALAITAGYALLFNRLHVVAALLVHQTPWAVLLIGFGTLLRLFSDAPGAVLQTRGRIAVDSYLLAGSDIFWALATLALLRAPGLLTASLTYAGAGMLLVCARLWAVSRLDATPWPPRLDAVRRPIVRRLLSFGSLVLVAQLAEYFYAPTDYILINHFLPADVAAYAPGVQIDLGLLMLVTGLAAVLLPKAALAHARGAGPIILRYYLRGTFASALLLTAAGTAVWFSYPLLFHIWFGAHPPDTRAILDLVLAGTVIGGSSAVGRSLLIGMGKVKLLTLAAIIAGVVNVVASYCFVKYAGLGLRGILYGTLVAVVGRCGLWMPWYVLKTLRPELSHPGAVDVPME